MALSKELVIITEKQFYFSSCDSHAIVIHCKIIQSSHARASNMKEIGKGDIKFFIWFQINSSLYKKEMWLFPNFSPPGSPHFHKFPACIRLHDAFLFSCLSYLSYCPIVWHYCDKRNSDKLEWINESCLRFIFDEYHSSYDKLLNNINRPSLHNRTIHDVLLNSCT